MVIYRSLSTVLMAIFFVGHVHAGLLWDEQIDGDLPSIFVTEEMLPNLILEEGINEIRGSSSWVGEFVSGEYQGLSDVDHSRLTLQPGLKIDHIDYVFNNVNLLQIVDPVPLDNNLRVGYALTSGRYATEDALYYRFWDLPYDPERAVTPGGNSLEAFPIAEPSDQYLFGSWVGGAPLPKQWDFSWGYNASITVSRIEVSPVPVPGTLAIFLAGLLCMSGQYLRRYLQLESKVTPA